jgi:transcriptional regulator GlxA family with amidase domain
MTPRRAVMVAMPCAEVMEIGGTLDVFYAANVLLAEAGSSDPGYAIEVVSPVPIVRSWPGLCIKAERSYHDLRGPIDTLIITGTDTPDKQRRMPSSSRGWRVRHRERGAWSASVRARSCSRRLDSWTVGERPATGCFAMN